MGETWRRVVIGSAFAVYLAGLGCAGGLLVGHVTRGIDTRVVGLFTIDRGAPAAGQEVTR